MLPAIPNSEIRQPSIHQLRERYRQLKSLDLVTADLAMVSKRIRFLTKGMTISSPAVNVGVNIYRARIFKSAGEKPSSRTEVSHPPPPFVKRMGRANRLGVPMFYGSSGYVAAIFEVRPEVGDYIAVGRWSLSALMRVNHVGYSDRVFKRLGSDRRIANVGFKEAIAGQAHPSRRYVHEKLAQEFARDIHPGYEHEYKASVAIAEMLLSDVVDGNKVSHRLMQAIVYPALLGAGNSDNFAIVPAFVDNSMVLKEVSYLKAVEQPNPNEYRVTTKDWANSIAPDGTIEWKGREPQWAVNAGDTLTIELKAGQWQAHDQHGRVVDPH